MSRSFQRKARYKRVKLDPTQLRLWQDTLAALSWIAPGFVHIIYTMLHNSQHDDVALFTEDIAPHTAATDGHQLIFWPPAFFHYDLMERCFIVLHEVMHEVLNHVRVGYRFKQMGKVTLNGKTLPYDHVLANILQDYIINAILIAAKMGKYNKDWLHNTAVAGENDLWLAVYFREWKQREKIKANCGAGDVRIQFDIHLDPFASEDVDPHEAPERNDAAWELAVNQAAQIQAAHGKMPASLKMFFDAVLHPVVDWTDHIRGLITRIMGSGAYNWNRLDRRLVTRGIGSPSITGFGAGLIVVGGDTSMSVFSDPTLIHRWVSEIGGMIENVNPEETHVVWCDTVVKRVDVCTDPIDVRKMVFDGIPGGGGTHFNPVFKYIEDNDLRPDVLIYLTDGDGTFPAHEPDYPVIWGDISGEKEKYPFGTVVHVPAAND